MFGWDIALGLELLVVVFGFILWFKAAEAEAGPRKLARIVAIVVIIFAVLLAVCTVTRAFMYAGKWKEGPHYKPWYKMHAVEKGEKGEGWRCPCCGAVYGKGRQPRMGMGMMREFARPPAERPPAAAVEKPGPE